MKFNNKKEFINGEYILIRIIDDNEYQIFLKFLSKYGKLYQRFFDNHIEERKYISYKYPNISIEKEIDRCGIHFESYDEYSKIFIDNINVLSERFKLMNNEIL